MIFHRYQVNDVPSPSWVRIVASQADEGAALGATIDEAAKKLPLKLLHLARRWNRIPSVVWAQCVREMDEIYQVRSWSSAFFLVLLLKEVTTRLVVVVSDWGRFA